MGVQDAPQRGTTGRVIWWQYGLQRGAVGWFGEVVEEGVWGALWATKKASTVSSPGPQDEKH
jgi:hypothetical protein